jgi:hypothetical protein
LKSVLACCFRGKGGTLAKANPTWFVSNLTDFANVTIVVGQPACIIDFGILHEMPTVGDLGGVRKPKQGRSRPLPRKRATTAI